MARPAMAATNEDKRESHERAYAVRAEDMLASKAGSDYGLVGALGRDVVGR